MDAYLWSLDCLLQPMIHVRASCGRCDPIGTVHHETGGSSVACASRRLPCREHSGLLGASVESAQSPPCWLEHQRLRRWCLGNPCLKEILQHLRPLYNCIGEHPTLLGQPFLIDDLEDCNDVCKVFLVVPTGVNKHVEVGLVRKFDFQGLRFFLGRDNVYLRHVLDGRPVAQLPFLALSIIQPTGSLEGDTHFGVLPESGTKQKFLERRLWRSL